MSTTEAPPIIMQRERLIFTVGVFVGIAAWAFLCLALLSFSPDDWPSHRVYPHAATSNLCGSAGAFIAYYMHILVGHGAYPVLFFVGAALILTLLEHRLFDLWLRAIGLLVLAAACAALIHSVRPGDERSLPEGYGGMVGIAVASFMQQHFSVVGSRLILVTALFVGLILAADDIVMRFYRGTVWCGFWVYRAVTQSKLWEWLARFRQSQDAADVDEQPTTPKRSSKIRINKASERETDEIQAAVATIEEATDDVENVEAVDDKEEDVEEVEQEAEAEEPEAEEPEPEPAKPPVVVRLPGSTKPRQTAPPPPKELGDYELPGWELLDEASTDFAESQEAIVREKAAILEQALHEYNVNAHVTEIDTGPVITMFELSLAPGTKVSQLNALSNDIARALKAGNVRIVAPLPGKNTVGIEVPNAEKEKVRLRDLMQLAPEATRKMMIPLFLGKDASGEPLIADMASMPHCLMAGTTGSGKSVCINTIIMSILYTQRPDWVKLILFDPKVVEMAPFRDIPHLMCPVITETGRAANVLEWACEKMDERYGLLAEAGVRNIAGYNKLSRDELIERFNPSNDMEEAKIPKRLPYIVIVIDELADLMMTSGKETEQFIVRLAQKSRAVGIHLILATQRPSANVVTGLIKSNMPSRVAFRVQSRMDSRIVLDQNGADLLLGQGDMLYLPPGASKPVRAQGTYVDDREIRDSVKLVKELAEAQYEPELMQIKSIRSNGEDMERDELFDDAVRVVCETKRGSVSLLQRRLTIGYGRASRLIEQMAEAGILGEYKGSQAREVMITIEDWDQMQSGEAVEAEAE